MGVCVLVYTITDFVTCSECFSIQSEGPYLSFGTLLEDKI